MTRGEGGNLTDGSTREHHADNQSSFIGPIPIALAVVGLQGIYAAVLFVVFDLREQAALFGDSFGGLTALFSGLAFGGMIYAIVLQSRELALQREELRLTREEMKATRSEQKRSADAQADLVQMNLLASRIQGKSALAQGLYQYAAAYGANASKHVAGAHELKSEVDQLLRTAAAFEDDYYQKRDDGW